MEAVKDKTKITDEEVATLPAEETEIETALKKFNLTEATLNKMTSDCLAMTVMDPGDKKGYDAAHEMRMNVKGVRVIVEQTRKDLKKKAIAFGKAVEGEAKRITGILTPLEIHLQAQEKIVDDEKERLKEEKIVKARNQMRERVKTLATKGMLFNGIDAYTYLDLSISQLEVSGHSDKIFDLYVEKLTTVYEAETKRKEDEAAETAKIKKEQDEEAERLAEQKKIQEVAAAKIKADQKIIEDEKKVLAKLKFDSRVTILADLDMHFDGGIKFIFHYKIDGTEMTHTLISGYLEDLTDADFNNYVEMLEKDKEIEDKRQEDEAAQIKLDLETKAQKEVEDKAEEEKKEKEHKEEQERKDEELRKAMLPDQEKLNLLADTLEATCGPLGIQLSHSQSMETLNKAKECIVAACKILRGPAKEEKQS